MQRGALADATRVPHRSSSVEWPTVAVAAGCWGAWVAVLVLHDRLPWPVVVAWLALSGGWYMSLQHEVIHGHPTPWRWVNVSLAAVPLSFWLPLDLYRRSHLLHHEVELTRVGLDPESFYVAAELWETASRWRRLLFRLDRTLVGRLLLGPLAAIPRQVLAELRLVRHDRRLAGVWVRHILGVVVVGWAVFGWFGMPVWQYLIGYCWFGLSISYLRSFAEHLAVPEPATRSAVVRSGWFFGLLFLNNNLHHTHHASPGAAWYRLPRLTRESGAEAHAAGGAGLYSGYFEIIRRFAVRPISEPVSPLDRPVNTS